MKSTGLEKIREEEVWQKANGRKISKKNNFRIQKVRGDHKKTSKLNTVAMSLPSTSFLCPFSPPPTTSSGNPLNPSAN